jgi:homocysteine S-methyltransferase
MSSFVAAINAGPVVLDGGLATHLEARGNELSDHLWSARLVLDEPDEVVAAHRDFYAAGARVATTASYQASFDGLARIGLGRAPATTMLRDTVRLADVARRRFAEDSGDDRPRWIAASIGPYGAYLADGSEYRGGYGRSVRKLARWHRPRLEVLAEAGADVLALETIPNLAEVEALLSLVSGSGVACWLSLTCEGTLTRRGEPLAEAFAMAADVDEVVAVGVNCCTPADVAPAVALAATRAGKPTLAEPNSGETWDPGGRRWLEDPEGIGTRDGHRLDHLVDTGADLVGGCCRTTPADIAALVTALGA